MKNTNLQNWQSLGQKHESQIKGQRGNFILILCLRHLFHVKTQKCKMNCLCVVLKQNTEFMPLHIIETFIFRHQITWAGRLSASILKCGQQLRAPWRSSTHSRPHLPGWGNLTRNFVWYLKAKEDTRLYHILSNMSVELSLAGEPQISMRAWKHFQILREHGQQFDLCLKVVSWLPLNETKCFFRVLTAALSTHTEYSLRRICQPYNRKWLLRLPCP